VVDLETGNETALVPGHSQQYPAEEMADLYLERWQIEVKFRNINTTSKMKRVDVQTPKMEHKTLALMVIAYNLPRSTM
jgi:hypothetical protein